MGLLLMTPSCQETYVKNSWNSPKSLYGEKVNAGGLYMCYQCVTVRYVIESFRSIVGLDRGAACLPGGRREAGHIVCQMPLPVSCTSSDKRLVLPGPNTYWVTLLAVDNQMIGLSTSSRETWRVES
jgi:hypothetical protein